MKKNLLLIPVAALAFAACTNETTEYVGDAPQAKEIAFKPVAQPNTRAAIQNTTFPTSQTMEVTAYKSSITATPSNPAANYFTKTTFSKGVSYWGGES